MLLVATKVTLKNHSTQCDVDAFSRSQHKKSRYSKGYSQSRSLLLLGRHLNGVEIVSQFPIRPHYYAAPTYHSTPLKPGFPAPTADVSRTSQIENQRIKRSRDISETRPIEARSSKSASLSQT